VVTLTTVHEELVQIRTELEELKSVKSLVKSLIEQRAAKEWYSTAEAAKLLGKAPYTVRQWCLNGRLHAEKRPCGRGKDGEWMISADELQRYRNEGLLPLGDR
jgi:hypothetical protein